MTQAEEWVRVEHDVVSAYKQKQDAEFERIWGDKAREQAFDRMRAAVQAEIEAQVAEGVPAALHTAVDEARQASEAAHRDVNAAKQRLDAHLRTSYTAADVPARAANRQRLEGELGDYQQLAAQADSRLERARAAVQQARVASWHRLGRAAEQAHTQAAAHATEERIAAKEEHDRRVAVAAQQADQAWAILNRLKVFRP